MKTNVQKPSARVDAPALQQIPLEQLKQVVGGVAPARNPVTNPAVSPIL